MSGIVISGLQANLGSRSRLPAEISFDFLLMPSNQEDSYGDARGCGEISCASTRSVGASTNTSHIMSGSC